MARSKGTRALSFFSLFFSFSSFFWLLVTRPGDTRIDLVGGVGLRFGIRECTTLAKATRYGGRVLMWCWW